MATAVNVSLIEDDDEDPLFELTSGGEPMNLSTSDVTAVIKPSEHSDDDSDDAHQLTEGDGLTIVDASAGLVRLTIPEAVNASPVSWFYKIRVTISGSTKTAIFGWMTVQDV